MASELGRKLALTQAVSDIATAQQSTEIRSVRIVIFVWAVAMLLTTAFLTPIEWQRYYLPAIPAVGLLAVLGMVEVIRKVRGVFNPITKIGLDKKGRA